MGNASWRAVDWDTHARATSSKTRDEIFTQRGIHPDLDPSKIKFREAVASDANPNPTPIILASDVTGSMGMLAEQIIKTDLGVIMRELYDRQPVSNPQIACMAIGDATCDRAPLQVTQFESSIVLADQLKKFWIEGGGGANRGESYALAWIFAAYKTKCDAIRKHNRKGYLFTIGDEAVLPSTPRDALKTFLGMDAQADIDTATLLADVEKDWYIFHLIVKPVDSQPVVASWRNLLGQRAIEVEDHTKLAAGIVAIIQAVEGVDHSVATRGWDSGSVRVVQSVTKQLSAGAR